MIKLRKYLERKMRKARREQSIAQAEGRRSAYDYWEGRIGELIELEQWLYRRETEVTRNGAELEELEAELRANDRAIAEKVSKGGVLQDFKEALADAEALERSIAILRRPSYSPPLTKS